MMEVISLVAGAAGLFGVMVWGLWKLLDWRDARWADEVKLAWRVREVRMRGERG